MASMRRTLTREMKRRIDRGLSAYAGSGKFMNRRERRHQNKRARKNSAK